MIINEIQLQTTISVQLKGILRTYTLISLGNGSL